MAHFSSDVELDTRVLKVAAPLALALALVGCGGGEPAPGVPGTQAQLQQATVATAVSPDLLMRWAESAYASYFSPPRQPTQLSGPYLFRYYPATQAYLGVAGQDIFVQGAPFAADTPVRVGSISDYQCTVVPQACWEGAEAVPIVRLRVDVSFPTKTYVIHDAQEWAAAWAERTDTHSPPLTLPAVDFATSAVVGGADGWASDGCHGIEPKLILRRGSDYRVLWGSDWLPPGTVCTAALEPRVAFALVPQPVGNVEFVYAPAY